MNEQVIPVRDPEKRRHMARELSLLYSCTAHHAPSPGRNSTYAPSPSSHEPRQQQQQQQQQTPACASSSSLPQGSNEQAQHVVGLYDAFANMQDGSVALMMEYMDGGSLQDMVDAVSDEGKKGGLCYGSVVLT